MVKQRKKRNSGQVSLNLNRGWLRLRFPQSFRDFQEARGVQSHPYQSLFLKEVCPKTGVNNWPLAEAIAKAINQDWLNDPEENLDVTLKKYLGELYREPRQLSPFARQNWTKEQSTIALRKIWESYLEYHLAGKKISTQKNYDKYTKKIEPWLDFPINKEVAKKVRNEFIKENTALIKMTAAALEQSVNWAIAEEIYTGKNVFKDISKEILPQKRVDKITKLPVQFVAFTEEEVQLILSIFQERYKLYYPFYRFKFLTGCRGGEARALTWEDVKFEQKVIHFNKTHIENSVVSTGTKDRKNRFRHRQFPMSELLFNWLKYLSTITPRNRHNLVFPNRDGYYLSSSALISAWGNENPSRRRLGVVAELALEGKVNYLPSYNTRHTFVSFCLDRGMDVKTIADWCGNSDRVIQEVYKSRSRDVDLSKMPQW